MTLDDPYSRLLPRADALSQCMAVVAPSNYYSILGVVQAASPEEIKRAYHRTLLQLHPDKNAASGSAFNVAVLQEAYRTLTTPALRAQHDLHLQTHTAPISENPKAVVEKRPAHVVSLEEFAEVEGHEGKWSYECRCGSKYHITEAQMEEEIHLVGCDGCSETILVGYEVVVEED